MTTLELILLASTVFFVLAYAGLRMEERRWKSRCKAALDQTERALAASEQFRTLLRMASASNQRMAELLAMALMCLKKRDDEGEEWKRG